MLCRIQERVALLNSCANRCLLGPNDEVKWDDLSYSIHLVFQSGRNACMAFDAHNLSC
jgi:hypothetical protein